MTDFRGMQHALRKRWEIWRDFSYWVPWSIPRDCMVPFAQINESKHAHRTDKNGWFWAKKLSEPLYFYRGTLTSAINLASVIWPECHIQLLGVDLNTYGYFFDPKEGRTQMEKFHDINEKRIGRTSAKHHFKSHRLNTHATALAYETEDDKKLAPIQTAFPRMAEELKKTGRQLLCSNPTSLLVKENYLPYAPVIPL